MLKVILFLLTCWSFFFLPSVFAQDYNVAENKPGAVIVNINVKNPQTGATYTFQTSDDRFEVLAGQLRLKANQSLSASTDQTINLLVSVYDQGTLVTSSTFVVHAISNKNLNTAPTNITLSSSRVPSGVMGRVIGTLTVTDLNIGDTSALSIDDSRFEIINNATLKLKSDQSLDYNDIKSVQINITATDRSGLSYTKAFTITVSKPVDASTTPKPSTPKPVSIQTTSPQDVIGDSSVNISDQYLDVRGTPIGSSGVQNNQLLSFASSTGIKDFFMIPHMAGGDSILNVFITIAFGIKNFFIVVAVIFLMIGVLKLLFSGAGDEDIKKWKNNIIWVSIGIFLMQIAFSAWKAFLQLDTVSTIGGGLGWTIWTTIFSPIVNILQFLAGGAFLIMAIYAFYTIVTGGGDEEKLKKGKSMVIYGLVGFLLIRIPRALIEAFYGNVDCPDGSAWTMADQCDLVQQSDVNVGLQIFGKILEFFNGFLMLICVLLVIYAGWLVLISAGDEEKLKKAKNTVLYILIGFIILAASHAIFRFFIMQ